ncbi:4'-phosphopantetheinyl transferase family protein [Leifsonia sp. NPDC058230]|uniref:4'-phosphopantetheinyl transferase family protein n=1 Tax=Leifsonia sp. NPDC058230 TaxID=3346391 RepID=UPI0036DCBDE8
MQATFREVTVRRVDAPDPLSRASRSAAGHAALSDLVADLAGVESSEVVIESRCPDCGGPHGRPVVMAPDAAVGIRVSLAYAGDVVVAAARRGGAIGVDAELRDRAHTGHDERRAIQALAPGDGDPLIRWTRIEAVLKADGRGLRVEPGLVRFEQQAGRLVAGAPDDPRRYAVRDVPLGDDVIVTVALEVRARDDWGGPAALRSPARP